MANNADGSIVLSVKIDTDTLNNQTKKLNDEILKAVKSESRIAVETEKANQALLKTQILQEKLNSLKEKSRSEQEKANVSASKAAEAASKAAAAEQKVQTEKAKTVTETKKAETAEINKQRAVVQTITAIQNQNTAAERTSQAIEKTKQEQEKTRQAFEKTFQMQEKSFQEQEKTKQSVEKTTQSVEKSKQAQEKTTQETIKTRLAQEKLKNATTKTTAVMKQLASTLGVMFGVREILRFSNEASKLASQQEANLKRLDMLYGESAKYVYEFANANANAFGMAKSAAYDAAADYGNIFRTFADGAKSAQMTNDMLRVTAVIASQTGRTYEDVFEKIRSGLYGNTRAIDDLGLSVRQSSLMQTQAYQQISQNGVRSWNSLTDAELQNARALGIIEQANIHYGNSILQSTALTRSQFNAAWADFKATWGTVINGVLIPVMNVLTKIINLLSVGMQAIAKLMGKSVEMSTVSSNIGAGSGQMANNTEMAADNIGTAAGNQKKLTKGVKDTNKELKKTLAGFDELNILQSNNEAESTGSGSGTGGGAGGGAGVGDTGVTAEVPTSRDEGGEAPDVEPWKSAIAGLVEVLVGSGLVALGIILCTMGHVALGVGVMLAGFLEIGIGLATLGEAFDTAKAKEAILIIAEVTGVILVSLGVILLYLGQLGWGVGAIIGGLSLLAYSAYEASKTSFEDLMSLISTLTAFLGGAMLAIGVMLCWFQMWGWGIAAIVVGITLFVASAYSGTKDDGKGLQDWIAKILGIAGGALAGIGIILIMVGSVAWGVACLIAGIAIFAVAAVNLADTIPDKVKNWINIIMTIVSAAALVVGIVLLCTGQVTPLSIGLVVGGAVGLAAELALNWNAIKDKAKEVFNSIENWLKTWGLLVLGVILCVSGVGIPLGISLMIEGGANLTEAQDPLWTVMKDKVKEVWTSIQQYWKDHIAKYFKSDWWKKLGEKAIKGLANAIIAGLNGIIDAINKFGFDMPDVLGGGHIGFNIPKIPKLAKGAVIPANKPFLSVLGDQKSGTNIEAPLKTIEQALENVLVRANIESGERSAPTTVVLQVNDREFGRAVVDLGGKENRIRGNSFVKTKLIYG